MRKHTLNIKATRAKYKTRNTVITSSLKFLCSCVSAVIPVDPSQPERGLIHVGSGVPGAVRFQIVNQHGLRPPFVRSFLFTYADRITDSIQQLYTEFLVVNLAPNNNIVPPPPPPPPGQSPLPAGQPPLPVSQPSLPVVQVPVVAVGQVHPPADPTPSSPPRPSLLNPPYLQAHSLPPVSSSGPDIEVLWERRAPTDAAAAGASTSGREAAAGTPTASRRAAAAGASASTSAGLEAPSAQQGGRKISSTVAKPQRHDVTKRPDDRIRQRQGLDSRQQQQQQQRHDSKNPGARVLQQRHDVKKTDARVSQQRHDAKKRPIFERLGPVTPADDRTTRRRKFIDKARSRKGRGGRVERESCRGNGGGVGRNVGRRGGGVKPNVKAQRHEEHESDGTL